MSPGAHNRFIDTTVKLSCYFDPYEIKETIQNSKQIERCNELILQYDMPGN